MVKKKLEGAAIGELSAAVRDVIAERRRQVENEGWSEAHDDKHNTGDLAAAAGCYALFADSYPDAGSPPPQWPWTPEWWKPKKYRRDLVRATALLLAEIERVDRRTATATVSHAPRLADLGIDSALVESITRAQEPFVKVYSVTQNKADLLSDK